MFTDSECDDFVISHHIREEQTQSHSLLSAACHQYTLVDTVTTKTEANKLIRHHKFQYQYQTRGTGACEINICACKFHSNCEHKMKVIHSSENIKVLQRGRHSNRLLSSKVRIHLVIREQVDTIIRGTQFPSNYKIKPVANSIT